ncbi:MAG TPA: hypothetical protein VLY23_11095 [Candidatus Acidoferrum sp.]|nr:hypothetical protein [Candidatus Acidoferrum sp.]
MSTDERAEGVAEGANPRTALEIEQILIERGWLRTGDDGKADAPLQEWIGRAAELFGPHAADRESLSALLELVFSYDAVGLMRSRDNQEVLARAGAREVVRELAHRVLDGGDIDSDRFKQIIDDLKLAVPYRSRAMFHPIRLALAGRAGEGELDRIILLIDPASKVRFAARVKSTRERMREFCTALD